MSGTYVSLFSGIGGLDLAVEHFGFTCIGQVEWDASCSRVLERHWPDVPRWGDVATYPEHVGRSGRVEPPTEDHDRRGAHAATEHDGVDLVCGGFPCQPFSTAGR